MKLVEQQEKLIPPRAPIQQAEVELERSDAEASVMVSGADGSEGD